MNNEPLATEQPIAGQDAAVSTTTNRHRRGHVARLPKVLRDKINAMLDDGVPYADIVNELQKSKNPPVPYPLTEEVIGSWKRGGYQDYLRDQAWRDQLTANADRFLDLAQSNDGPQIAAGGMKAALIHICQLMDELFNPKSGECDPANHVRIANTLARLSGSIVSLSQYRDDVAKAKAADPESPEAQQEARRKLVAKIDEVFGLGRRTSAARVQQMFPLPGDPPTESNFEKNHLL